MAKRIRRPSPAMVLGVIALVLAMAGGAYAAKKIGPGQIRANAVRTAKIQDGAVTTTKLADNAVTSTKIVDGTVGTTDLADGAVTAPKLAASERSLGFVFNQSAGTPLAAGTDTTVATLTLPVGSYVLDAKATIGNNAAVANRVLCELKDDGTTISSGNGTLEPLAVFSVTLTLPGTSDGGTVTLSCNPDAGANARSRVLTAIQVGTLQTQP